jgi:hydroxylysine kinase
MASAEEIAAEEELRKHEKPQCAKDKAMGLAAEIFGLELDEAKVKQLESYDDVNYYLRCTDGSQYVFKIHNGVESDNSVFLNGMNELLLHLRAHGIAAPHPVNSTAGDWMTKVELPLRSGAPKQHAIRLLDWVAGEMMNEQEVAPALLQATGAYLGNLDKVLDGFDHEGFHRSHAWDVRNTSMLPSFYEYLDEPWRLELIQGVVGDFEGVVLPASGEFRMGLLQADFNDANIIIARGEDGAALPGGVIDFGDAVHSWRVNDVAIAMAYVMVCIANPENKRAGFEEGTDKPESLLAAAHFLAGFESNYPLQPTERAMVWKLASCRLATSATMGWYSWALDPTNEYLKYVKMSCAV